MRTLVSALFALFLTSSAFGQVPAATPAAAKPAPKVEIVDGKITIQAEAVQLSRLIRLLDLATGLTSTVSPDTANRTLSVRFSNLDFDSAIKKIFDGQNLDYIVIKGKGIQVKGVSLAIAGAGESAAYTTSTPAPFRVNEATITTPGAIPSAVGTNPPPAAGATIQSPMGVVNANNAARPPTVAPAATPAPAPVLGGAIPTFSQPTVVAPSTPGGAMTPAPSNPLGPTFTGK